MSIVVSQTQEVHEQIEIMLDKLRKFNREQGGQGSRKKVKSDAAGMGAAGGMGGGMGSGEMSRPATPAAKASPSADLLQGVRGLNEGNQSKQSGKLQQMYNEKKGGVGAGDAF